LPPYLLDPRLGLTGPFPSAVEEGWKRLAADDPKEARRIFSSAGSEPAARIGLIEALVESGSLEEARAGCRSALADGIDTAPLLAACGQAEGEAGNWSEAYDLFDGASVRLPESSGLWSLRAHAAPLAVEFWLEGARTALSAGEFEEAQQAAEKAISIDSQQPEALRVAGEAALGAEDFAVAAERYEAAWRQDPSDIAVGEKAGDLAMKVGRYAAAEEIFGALARTEPRFASRAREAREEALIANWPPGDRAAAHTARLTRAQAAILLWRLMPEIRSLELEGPSPVATDILSRKDRRILSHCLQLGLLSVDASTHRARPDAVLSRAEGGRMLARAAGLGGSTGVLSCLQSHGREEGGGTAATDCGLLTKGKSGPISGAEFRRGLAAIRAGEAKAS
jgi:tetratricopeptide (TPR) repeat protein